MKFKLRQLGSIRKLLACANCTARVLFWIAWHTCLDEELTALDGGVQ